MVRPFYLHRTPRTLSKALIRVEVLMYKVVVTHIDLENKKGMISPPISTLERCGPYVRHLLVGVDATAEQIVFLLACCPAVIDLAIWNINIDIKLLPHLERMPLLRLSTHINVLFGSALNFSESAAAGLPALANITHLDLANSTTRWRDWEGLAYLPQLTHLSILDRPEVDLVKGILENCKTLRFLALLSEDVGGPEIPQLRRSAGLDSRVVICKVADYAWDWKYGADGGRDLWAYIEAAVQEGDLDFESKSRHSSEATDSEASVSS